MNSRQKGAAKFYILVFAAFALLLSWLATGQKGPDFSVQGENVYIENSTGTSMEKVQVLMSGTLQLDCIERLPAGEKMKVLLPEGMGRAKLSAISPFHWESEKIVDLQTVNSAKYDSRFAVEKTQKKFALFNADISVCNYESTARQFSASEEHDDSYFKVKDRTVVFNLAPEQCKSFHFDFSSQKEGLTGIRLAVNAEDYQKSSIHEILVEG